MTAGLWFGGDYNPEQWDEVVWAEDDALMRAARVNTATVGVFSWARLEPEEGRYDFGWLDATLDRLAANQVQVILATPTASPPPWFTLAHPDFSAPCQASKQPANSYGHVVLTVTMQLIARHAQPRSAPRVRPRGEPPSSPEPVIM